MSNIDNELAFGEYVSIPIRTEKTAEEKWIELGKILTTRLINLQECLRMARIGCDVEMSVRLSTRQAEVETALSDMEYLDT